MLGKVKPIDDAPVVEAREPKTIPRKNKSKNRAALAFVVAAATSAFVWFASPWLTGQREPWDAGFPFYIVALLIAGAVAGSMTAGPLWALYLGSFTGQIAFEAVFLKIGPMFLLGALFLLTYGLVFLAAASVMGHLRLRFKKGP